MISDAALNLSADLQIMVRKAIGQRFAVVGKSGSGKTNTMHVIVEGWLDAGLPCTIIDPMRQFRVLKDVYPIIIAGRWKHATLEVTEGNAAALARFSYERRLPVVLELSLYSDDEQQGILLAYLRTLWTLILSKDEGELQPYGLFIDEAQMYAPEGERGELAKTLIDMAKRGRHMQLTSMVATQRSASIVKDFLTQANMLITHRVMLGNDTKVIGEIVSLPQKELNQVIRRMPAGGAVIVADVDLVGVDEDYLQTRVRLRKTAPTDETPVVLEASAPLLDGDLLDELRALMARRTAAAKPGKPEDTDALRSALADREAALAEANGEVERLRALLTERTAERDQALIEKQRLDKALARVSKQGAPAPGNRQLQMALPDLGGAAPLPPPVDEHISSRSLALRQNRQREKFDKLIRTLGNYSPKARLLLAFYMDEKDYVSIERAARALDKELTNLRKEAHRLQKLGLLVQKEFRSDLWRSDVEAYLQREFENLDAGELRGRLFEVAAS